MERDGAGHGFRRLLGSSRVIFVNLCISYYIARSLETWTCSGVLEPEFDYLIINHTLNWKVCSESTNYDFLIRRYFYWLIIL